MLKIKNPQDAGSGALFIAIGLAGLYFGSSLDFGTARRMGPGFFPMIISGLIALAGVLVLMKGLTVHGPAIQRMQLRPVLMLMLALVAFGLLIEPLGVVVATIALVVLAALARREIRWGETLILALCAAAFVVLVFVYGLGQALPVWWND